jgi:hypothetical protein
MACCPHRGPARARGVSNGPRNACSLVRLTVHGLRNPCRKALFSSSNPLPRSKRDKTPGACDRAPTRAVVLQVATAFAESMSRRTNDEAALSCKSLGQHAPTRATCMTCQSDSPHVASSKVPVRHGPRHAMKRTVWCLQAFCRNGLVLSQDPRG